MKFNEQLNQYITAIGCTSKELSKSSGLSYSVISRYRNGERIPSLGSEQLNSLIKGIEVISLSKGISNIEEKDILPTFTEILNEPFINFDILNRNFSTLVSILKINMAEMARAMNFDASYLSRIRAGKRKPADINNFVESVCQFVVERYEVSTAIAELLSCSTSEINNRSLYLAKLKKWLCENTEETSNHINEFLQKIDEFDLNEYIRLVHFDEMKVPSLPIQLPMSKNYYGIEEMKHGELDFFKSTVLSKSTEPVFMCSDMQMDDLAEDIDFGKKWMFAIAMTLKKGLHLNIIHNVERPFNEMMLGLESWIPIYMTGQVSPYYIRGIHNSIYCHLNYVSGNCALSGECIRGYHVDGKYYFTNSKEAVDYYKKKMNNLLVNATPLMDIFRKESSNIYDAFMHADSKVHGDRRRILSVPPLSTISNTLLTKILDRNKISEEDKNVILQYATDQKELLKAILTSNLLIDEVAKVSKEEFNKHRLSLSLSGCFYDKKIYYTYDEYLEHFDMTEKFANKNSNYCLNINNGIAFRNIQISINKKNWVMISKENAPSIHFVIRHSKLRDAIENFVAPIIE